MNITTKLKKILNGDEENINLVASLIHAQGHPSNIIAVLAMLEDAKLYHWIKGTPAEERIIYMLKDLPQDLLTSDNRYSYARLFRIILNHLDFQSEQNLTITHSIYMNYCHQLKDEILTNIKSNTDDTRSDTHI